MLAEPQFVDCVPAMDFKDQFWTTYPCKYNTSRVDELGHSVLISQMTR